MLRRLTRAALLLAALGSAPVHAAAYDPDLTWRTLQTEHFNLTFHGGEEALAEEVAHICEDVWRRMSEELAYSPRRRTEVVIVDNTDSANGYAMTLPVNTIVIFVTAPTGDSTLSLYENWSDAIMTHEYTHILHIDTVEGLPRLLRMVLGRIVSVNNVSPGWVVEGQATFQETRHTNGGRGRSNIADMIKRMAVLEDDFPPLGNMDGYQVAPPGGNLRYLFGQDFAQFVSDTAGRDVWTDFIHTYGGWVPYLLPGKRVFGEPILALYEDWKAHLETRYAVQQAEVARLGLTEFELLSDGEDQCSGPTYSPDGAHIVWSCSDKASGSGIYLADGDGQNPEVEVKGGYASDFAWRPDSDAFAFSSLHTVNRFNAYADAYLQVLGGSAEPLTRGKRARDPAFSPDGEQLIVVTNEVQNNQLARLTVDRTLKTLTEYDDHTQIDSPRWSPDGSAIAVSMWQSGQRDLWLFSPEGEPVRRLTADLATDLDPAWSTDGRTLYFSSDRTGIYNIYSIDLETEALRQITNVLGGAFHPSASPDGEHLVYASFSHNGTDIARMELDADTGWPRGRLPQPLTAAAALSDFLPATPIPLAEPWEPEATADDEAEPDVAGDKKRRKDRARPPTEVHRQLTDAEPFPGLHGLGGPVVALPRNIGALGLPGEDVSPRGEFDRPQEVFEEDDVAEVELEERAEEDFDFSFPVGRYNPLPTLLPPRYVLPLLYQTSYGLMGTLNTGGVDTLRRYAYSGFVSYRTDSRYVGWGASLVLNRWIPIYSAGAYSYTVPYGDIYEYEGPPAEGGAWVPSIESNHTRYWDRRTRAYVQVSHGLSERRSIFARWGGSYRQPLEPLTPAAYRPSLPTRGFLSSVGGGWRYSYGRSYAKSISPEKARVVSVVGEVFSPLLGSYTLDDQDQPVGFSQLQLTTEWREYKALPYADNHVLAWKLAGGAAFGDEQRYGNYRLGGSFGESAYYTLPDEWRALRGFPPATVYGDWFYLGSLEYRLPLLYVDRGVGTVPFFARYLSGAVFVDAGNAFSNPSQSRPLDIALNSRAGAGAELKGTAVLGWGVPITVRLGYAFALYGDGGYAPGDLRGAYAWFGSSF